MDYSSREELNLGTSFLGSGGNAGGSGGFSRNVTPRSSSGCLDARFGSVFAFAPAAQEAGSKTRKPVSTRTKNVRLSDFFIPRGSAFRYTYD